LAIGLFASLATLALALVLAAVDVRRPAGTAPDSSDPPWTIAQALKSKGPPVSKEMAKDEEFDPDKAGKAKSKGPGSRDRAGKGKAKADDDEDETGTDAEDDAGERRKARCPPGEILDKRLKGCV
jgi:hypothetical protein